MEGVHSWIKARGLVVRPFERQIAFCSQFRASVPEKKIDAF
jgi:hypothetical protein